MIGPTTRLWWEVQGHCNTCETASSGKKKILGFYALPEYIQNHKSFFNSNISLFFIQYLSVSCSFSLSISPFDARFESLPCFLNAPISFLPHGCGLKERGPVSHRRPTVVGSGTWENNGCLAHVFKAWDSWGFFSSFLEMATTLFTCFISFSSSCRHILGS